ncbi:MAG: hypothetical protein EPN17_01545 [Methylobacter sp.]|nr:MAG: hypothetical protein EPN17_01545 [Methylobacter sp.]
MKNYRLFLLGFVVASLVFLTGFEKPGANTFPAEQQASFSEAKKNQSKNVKPGSVNSKQKTIKHRRTSVQRVNDDAELQKSLDLSIPFNGSENAGLAIEQDRAVQAELSNLFATEKKKKSRPLYLDGQILMSQEPEVDKKKSLDGAGIVINLKR